MLVVFGSLNIDLMIRVPALPVPGETVLTDDYLLKPGGKGLNQAVAAARAGAVVAMAGAVGADPFGAMLLEVLETEGIDRGLVRTVQVPTGCASICVDRHGENMIAVAAGANRLADADAIPSDRFRVGSTFVLQMEVPHVQNWRLVERTRGTGARVVLSVAPAAPVPPERLRDVSVLVVNRLEADRVVHDLGLDVALAGDTPSGVARSITERTGAVCVITLGSEGAVAAEPGGALWAVGALDVDPVDTTGAGDTFTGILAAGLDAGDDLPTSLRRASVGAGLACLSLGAQDSMPRLQGISAHLGEVAPPRRLA
ncbi:MAG TPA: ribokinase [Azospirillaceae bacterium]|nr:ribokinase [Azospirillaceae bacterium]